MSREKTEITVTVKKSELTAKSQYDYNKLTYHNERFIDCSITEKDEELECIYVPNGYHPFHEIRDCTKQKKNVHIGGCRMPRNIPGGVYIFTVAG